MRIGIIQGTSQKQKNSLLCQCVEEVMPSGSELINFGIYENSDKHLSYVQVALCVSLLLESKAVDFVVTGCSSGQGMMLACNALPGVMCGYIENVSDAYLFGRINHGNAVSYPLGSNFGWTTAMNLKETMRALFCEPMGTGYPQAEAKRQLHDTSQIKTMIKAIKKKLVDVLPLLDQELVKAALHYDPVYDYIMEKGTNETLKAMIQNQR